MSQSHVTVHHILFAVHHMKIKNVLEIAFQPINKDTKNKTRMPSTASQAICTKPPLTPGHKRNAEENLRKCTQSSKVVEECSSCIVCRRMSGLSVTNVSRLIKRVNAAGFTSCTTKHRSSLLLVMHVGCECGCWRRRWC